MKRLVLIMIISILGLSQTVNAFNDGLSGGAEIALSYAMLGALAVKA